MMKQRPKLSFDPTQLPTPQLKHLLNGHTAQGSLLG